MTYIAKSFFNQELDKTKGVIDAETTYLSKSVGLKSPLSEKSKCKETKQRNSFSDFYP